MSAINNGVSSAMDQAEEAAAVKVAKDTPILIIPHENPNTSSHTKEHEKESA